MGPLRNSLRKHHRGAEHLRTCTECWAAMERERRYLERLRSAEIPAASTDFTSRLLERTHVLAAAAEPAGTRKNAARRTAAISASGVLAATGVLAAAALLLAGDPVPQAEGPTSASAVSPLSLASGGVMADIGPGTTASGRADASTPAASPPSGADGVLTSTDLAALREAGWACPELASLGFELMSAKAVVRQGLAAVELRLSKDGLGATVVEQRTGTDSPVSTVPTNLQTGRPASEDGFVAAPELLAGSVESHSGGSAAWVHAGEPVGVIYRTGDATVSYFSDAGAVSSPGPDNAAVLRELIRARMDAEQGIVAGVAEEPGHAAASEELRSEPLTDRLRRGFQVMLGLQAQ